MVDKSIEQIIDFARSYRNLIFGISGAFSIVTIHIIAMIYGFSKEIMPFVDVYFVSNLVLILTLFLIISVFIGRVSPIIIFISCYSIVVIYYLLIYACRFTRYSKKKRTLIHGLIKKRLGNTLIHYEFIIIPNKFVEKKLRQLATLINRRNIIIQLTISALSFSAMYIGVFNTFFAIIIIFYIFMFSVQYLVSSLRVKRISKAFDISMLLRSDNISFTAGLFVSILLGISVYFGYTRAKFLMDAGVLYVNSVNYKGKVSIFGKTSSGFIVRKIDSQGFIFLPLEANPVFSNTELLGPEPSDSVVSPHPQDDAI